MRAAQEGFAILIARAQPDAVPCVCYRGYHDTVSEIRTCKISLAAWSQTDYDWKSRLEAGSQADTGCV